MSCISQPADNIICSDITETYMINLEFNDDWMLCRNPNQVTALFKPSFAETGCAVDFLPETWVNPHFVIVIRLFCIESNDWKSKSQLITEMVAI